MLNGHAMMFRLSLALLSAIEARVKADHALSVHASPQLSDGTVDAVTPAVVDAAYAKVLSMLREVPVEVIVTETFDNPTLADVEKDFTGCV